MKRLRLPLILAASMISGLALAQEQEKESKIDEVVLIGYGSTKKKDATGSVSSLKADAFNKGTTTSPEQLLQGKSAGVQVTSASGDPNGQNAVRIRGFGTIRSGGEPLYVIDGVPLSSGDTSTGRSDALGYGSASANNPMNFIDPNDIESMDILKDAAATAIYGSRGANGVILITTKKGKKGKGQLSLSASGGVSTISNKYDLLDASQFAAHTLPANNYGSNVSGLDEILRTGSANQYNLSYGGGNDTGNYRVSLSYLGQQGIIKNSDLDKTNVSYNVMQKFFDNYLTLESSLSAAFTKAQNPAMSDNIGAEGDLMISALKWNPTRSFYDSSNPTGLFHYGNDNSRNPVDLLRHYTDKTKTLRLVGNIAATVKINKNLNFKSNFGVDYSTSKRGVAMSSAIWLKTPYQINGIGVAAIGNVDKFNYVAEQTLNYTGQISDNLKVEGLLGYSYQQFADQGRVNIVSGFGNMTDQNYYLDNIYAGTTQNSSGVGAFRQSSYFVPDVKMQSFFGRAILNFKDRYIVNGILRYDGSSKFGDNNRYGAFPSVSFAWNVGKESFTPEVFNDLKLRAGWGLTGNSDFPAGSSTTFLQPLSGSWRTFNFGNPDLRWEQTQQVNGGIDFAILKNKLSGSVDVYSKETKDVLMLQYQLQRPTDNPYGWVNLKNTKIKNKGVEVALNYKAIKTDNFSLEVGGNATYNRSKATGIDADGYNPITGIVTGSISGQGLSDVRSQGHFDGQELYQFNLYQFQGFDANGLALYETASGGSTTNPAEAIKKLSGSALPRWNVGLNVKMNYKAYDLVINGYGQYGGKIYDNTANALFYAAALQNGGNVTTDIITNGESVSNSNAASTRFLHSGDFFRLSNATLGYTLRGNGGVFEHISSIRFSFTAQNLFVITSYDGFDPEVNTNKMFNGVPSYGIDYASYPKSRTYTLGLNVNF